jgi:dTMP kinase
LDAREAIKRLRPTSGGRGILISFEGIDASGKNTQSKMLCDSLKEKGVNFEFLSFPVYSTQIGEEIKKYLSKANNYSPETVHLLYTANRYEFKSSIERWMSQRKLVVLNRYCESNIAYGVADGLPRLWLEQLESLMPQSDHVFYLKITPELSLSRKTSRDRYEADVRYLSRVSSVYDAMAVADSRWMTVDAERDVGIVHYEIMRTLSALLEEKSSSQDTRLALDNSLSSPTGSTTV